MTMKKMIQLLKKEVKETSLRAVANQLGYKSHATIRQWFINGKIPSHAIVNVKTFLIEEL